MTTNEDKLNAWWAAQVQAAKQEATASVHFDGDTTALVTALAKAQAAMPAANKNSTNDHFGSDYADLGEVLGCIMPALGEQGCFLMQQPDYDEKRGLAILTTTISGHGGSIITVAAAPLGRGSGPQAWASAVTYLRRVVCKSLFCLPEHSEPSKRVNTADDDGNAAQGAWNAPTPARTPAAPTNGPGCPECGGDMWDNRESRSGRQPDYKCKNRGQCNGAIWLTDDERSAFKAQLENVEDFNWPDRDDYQGGPF